MFFIGRGDCIVKVRDEKGKYGEDLHLDEGEHFGEISLLYRCNRSATVVSENYNTLAKLNYKHFNAFCIEYPEYDSELKSHILSKYKDNKINFLKNTVKQIEYLKPSNDLVLQKFIFTLKP